MGKAACSPTGYTASVRCRSARLHTAQCALEEAQRNAHPCEIAMHEAMHSRGVRLHLLLQQPYQMHGALAVTGHDERPPSIRRVVHEMDERSPHVIVGTAKGRFSFLGASSHLKKCKDTRL